MPAVRVRRHSRAQVRREFFALIDTMIEKLYQRGQDPNDPAVPSTFRWRDFYTFPKRLKYNMDEVGSNDNAGRKKKVMHKNTQTDGLKRAMQETNGDNKQFHVTLCITTCAAGTTPIPPLLGHSAPHSTAALPRMPRRLVRGICERMPNGDYRNESGIGVFVTKNGSMTKAAFPAFCRHFVANLPEGQGKGGDPVILIFDGHASRWNFAGLKYLMDNNVYCLCLPGHTSIWAQPNDGGVNASWKSTLGDSISAWSFKHLKTPGNEKVNKMTRSDFNEIAVSAWRTWEDAQHAELISPAGGNAIVTSWKGTGLEPYDRSGGAFWSAAVAKFGTREALADCTNVTHENDYVNAAAAAAPLPSHAPTLAATFDARMRARKEAITPTAQRETSTTAAPTPLPRARAPDADAVQPLAEIHPVSASTSSTPSTTALVPAVASSQRSAMISAAEASREAERLRAYMARLEGMEAGEQLALRCASSGDKAGLTKTDDGFVLVRKGHTVEELTLEAAKALSAGYVVPAQTNQQLSAEEAEAARKRAARQAAATRETEQRAAVKAAEQQWYEQQADLACELGIGFEDWQRIVTLLAKPPPVRIGNDIVMNSVLTGRAMVIDAAVEAAVAQPLHDSVRNAAERAADEKASGKRPREAGLEQTTWGMDVTEMMPKFDERDKTVRAKAANKRQEYEEKSESRAAKQKAAVHKACHVLLNQKGGDAAKLAIGDLITLIKWQNGTPPADKSKNNYDTIVAAWRALNVTQAELQAQAALHAAAPAAVRAPAQRGRSEEDEEDVDDDDDDEEEDDEDDDEEDADEDEEDAEEDAETYDAKCIHAQKGRGKTLLYHVEWEGYPDEEWTWEPPAHMVGTEALEAWEDGGREAWEEASKQSKKARSK